MCDQANKIIIVLTITKHIYIKKLLTKFEFLFDKVYFD